MTPQEIIRQQLLVGLPESWITDELIEAVLLARGGSAFMRADPAHAFALLRYAARIQEGQ